MNPRRRGRRAALALAVAGVLVGMGLLSAGVLRLEAREAQARADARAREALRLALYRMDALLTPLLAGEAARPYFHYRAFFPADRGYPRLWEPLTPQETLLPSPLLGGAPAPLRLHVEALAPDPAAVAADPVADPADPSHRWTLASPQAPQGSWRDLALRGLASPSVLDAAGRDLGALAAWLTPVLPADAPDLDAALLALARDGDRALVALRESAGQRTQAALLPGPPAKVRPGPEPDRSVGMTESAGPLRSTGPSGPLGSSGGEPSFAERLGAPLEPADGARAREPSSLAAPVIAGSGGAPPRTGDTAPFEDRAGAPSGPGEPSAPPSTARDAEPRQELGEYALRQRAAEEVRNLATRNEQRQAPPEPEPEPAPEPAAGVEFQADREDPARSRAGADAAEDQAEGGGGAAPASEAFTRRRLDEAPPGASPPAELGRGVSAAEAAGGVKDAGSQRLAPQSIAAGDAPGPALADDVPSVEVGPMRPVWGVDPSLGTPELLLVRRVRAGPRAGVQVVWLDWPALRAQLLESARDLVPGADLVPVGVGEWAASPDGRHLLAGVPVELRPGPAVGAGLPMVTPARTTLALAWLGVLGASGAIGLVLRASERLSERRAQFVSAVTHELRTPLTTFCLYTDMLDAGLVQDESARREYLSTLRGESRRLARIVESVLEFARLDRAGAPARRGAGGVGGVGGGDTGDAQRLGDLLDRARPAIEARLHAAGMTLDLESPPDASAARVRIDPAALERILVNLADNACKYAGDSPDPARRRLVIRTTPPARHALARRPALEVRVRDFGPGVPAGDRRRIFELFRRARRDEGSATPGLGLGLALSRALARSAGGDLRLARSASAGASPGVGAEFVLRLPAG